MLRCRRGVVLLVMLLLTVLLYLMSVTVMDPHKRVPWGWLYYRQNENGIGNYLVNQLVNCTGLFEANTTVQTATSYLLNYWKYTPATSTEYVTWTKNCSKFVADREYILTVSDEEKEFPIAFSILVYRDLEQVERLLRVIYRPSNFYCIHVDAKSSADFKDGVKSVATCLDNVFLSTSSVRVVWGEMSTLRAELICVRDLLKHLTWKYFINLTGQEFPLKTNKQLVRILKAYDGANDIEGTIKRIPDRKQRWQKAGKLPQGLTAVKGAIHIVANRNFMTYSVQSSVGKELLHWLNKTVIPDETFFATLNHNPQLNIPGTYNGTPETNSATKPFLARYKVWENYQEKCFGKYKRDICIFGIKDLPKMRRRMELFVNKFHANFQPLAYDCMEQRYFKDVLREETNKTDFNASFYADLGFVKKQIKS